MTAHRDFKLLVRARMATTGENYAAARQSLMAEREQAEAFYDKTVRTFFRDGTLISVPTKRKARVVVLLELLRLFEAETSYTEKQVNAILQQVHPDTAYLRRELVDYGFLTRAEGIYRVADIFPEPAPTVVGEMLPVAHQKFYSAAKDSDFSG